MPVIRGPRKARDQLLLEALGIITEPYPFLAEQGSQVLSNQQVYATMVGLKAGDVVSGIACSCSVAGSGLTLVKFGLYDLTGAKLAASADNSAAFASTGMISTALSAAYTVTADGGYYVACLAIGTTGPTLQRGAATVNPAAIGSGKPRSVRQTGQADLPASATFSTFLNPIWLAPYGTAVV